MPSVHWGLTGLGVPAPWCDMCHVDWSSFGVTDVNLTCLAARNAHTRGETAIFTSPVTRLPGPAVGSAPPLKRLHGRLRVRTIRKLSRQICGPIWFPYCVKGVLCTLNCNLVTQVMRDRVRGHFECIRAEVCSYFMFYFFMSSYVFPFISLSSLSFQVAVGARHRAMSFLFTLMMREGQLRIAHHRNAHPDARAEKYGQDPVQKCPHCSFDPREKWDPPQSHIYTECERRGELRNDVITKLRQVYPLALPSPLTFHLPLP